MGFFDTTTWHADTKIESSLPKCGQCGLYKQCESPKMEPTGRGKRPILFVGEAPGAQEDAKGEQFVGKAGQWLRNMLRGIGVNIEDCYKTNAAICRPPDNEILPLYIDSCRPNLIRTVRELKPRVIVLLGHSAVSSLIAPALGEGAGSITRWVGWRIPSPAYDAWLCPTYHPSYVLYEKEEPALVKIMKDHLRAAVALEKKQPMGITFEEVRDAVEPIPDVRLGIMRMKELSTKRGILAFDYECTGLKPERPEQRIVSASFCLDGEGTFACPIDESCHDVLRAVLTSNKLLKVGSNIKFEHRWSRKRLGARVRQWHWDTMLAAHALDNRREITSVKFQSFVRLGLPDWGRSLQKYIGATTANGLNRMADLPSLIYNGIDSLVEFKVMEHQKKEMGYV